jgi:hypothetical protein
MFYGMGLFIGGRASGGAAGGGAAGIDISAATFSDFFSVAGQFDTFSGFEIVDEGTKLFAVRRSGASLYQYNLLTAWDVSSATYIRGIGFAPDGEPQDCSLNPTGTRIFVTGAQQNAIHQGNLGTAWNLSTFAPAGSLPVGAQDGTPVSHAWNSDGTKLFVLGRDNSAVFSYTASTAWDVTSCEYDDLFFPVGAQVTTETGLDFSPDGTQMFVVCSGTDRIYQYDLATAWNIGTAEYNDVFLDVSARDTSPSDIQIRPDSGQMYLSGEQNNRINEFSLIILPDQATATNALGPFSWVADDTIVNQSFTSNFVSNGNSLTYSITGLPTGVVDDGDGSASGTPTAAGSGTITITATDAFGRETVSTASYTTALRAQATAAGGLGPFSFVAGVATSEQNLALDFTANGNTLTYAITGTALPSALSVSVAGALTGTPAATASSANYTVRSTDEYGRTTDSIFAVEVTAAPDVTAPTVSSVSWNDGTGEGSFSVDEAGTFIIATYNSASGTPSANGSGGWTGTTLETDSSAISSGSNVISFTETIASANATHFAFYVRDAAGNDSAVTTQAYTPEFAPTPPVITGAPTIAGTTTEGQVLTATPASVAGNPTPTRSWQWERGGVAISGATSITYTLVTADVGATITVVQTETNSEGSDTAESSPTSVIAAIGGSDTPATIMGANAISWFDTNTATMWQDSAKTIAATTSTDPVYTVEDEAGGDITTDDNARRGVLGNDGTYDYITMDEAHLSRAIAGDTIMYAIFAIDVPTNAETGIGAILTMFNNSSDWWLGDHMLLEENKTVGWFQARVSNGEEVYTPNSPNVDTLGPVVVEAIFDGTTLLSIALNGVETTTTQTPSAAEIAPNRYDIGRARESNTYTTDNGSNFRLYGMAICDAIPGEGERGSLRTWAASTNGVTI